MKVLVDEIDLETLQRIKHYFVSGSEIEFVEYCDSSLASYICEKPFYIEENILNLDKVLKTCEDVSWARSEIRNLIDWNEFSCFWWLMQEIKKQREIGRKINDIEYIFEKTKNRVPVQLVDIVSLNRGYSFESPYYCIIGNSNFGEMILYKTTDDSYDFVFDFSYKTTNNLGKEIISHNHFHPQDYDEAILDVMAWMSNDPSRFSWMEKDKR